MSEPAMHPHTARVVADNKLIAALEDLCDAGFDIHDDNTHAWGLVYVEDVRDLIEQWRAAL